MSSDTTWQSPSGPDDSGSRPGEPRFGAYGTPAAGQPAAAAHGATGEPHHGPGSQPQGAGAHPAAPGAVPQSPSGFFVAPKPGIIPLRPLSITEIIGGAFEALRANPKAMFVPAFIAMAVIGLLSAVQSYFSTMSFHSVVSTLESNQDLAAGASFSFLATTFSGFGSSLVTAALTALASTILTGLLIVAVSRSVLGRIATPGEVWERTKGRVWALIGQSILVGLMVSAAAIIVMILAIIIAIAILSPMIESSDSPGSAFILAFSALFILGIVAAVLAAFLGVRLCLATAALILENVGVIEGIKRSWKLTRGYFWHVLGTVLLAGIITAVATGVLSGIAGWFSGLTVVFTDARSLAMVAAASSFISSVVSAVILPFSAAVTALIYIDLRMRQEGLDVELRQSAGV